METNMWTRQHPHGTLPNGPKKVTSFNGYAKALVFFFFCICKSLIEKYFDIV